VNGSANLKTGRVVGRGEERRIWSSERWGFVLGNEEQVDKDFLSAGLGLNPSMT